MAFKSFFCFAILLVAVFAEKDAPKVAENDRVKKAVIIPATGAAYGYYGATPYNGGVYNGVYGGYGYPYAVGQQYYGTGAVYPYGAYDDGKYYPGKYEKSAMYQKNYLSGYNGYTNYAGYNNYYNGYPYAQYPYADIYNNRHYYNNYYNRATYPYTY